MGADDLHPAVAGAVRQPRADDARAVDGRAVRESEAVAGAVAAADGGADVAEEQQKKLLEQ